VYLGRIDLDHNWDGIRNKWVEAFRNRDEVPGMSVKQRVSAADEWCAEAYLETDFSALKSEDFEREVRKYLVFKVLQDSKEMIDNSETIEDEADE
jgi:type I restriction enzyme M protein